jgi:hypothetical protein
MYPGEMLYLLGAEGNLHWRVCRNETGIAFCCSF